MSNTISPSFPKCQSQTTSSTPPRIWPIPNDQFNCSENNLCQQRPLRPVKTDSASFKIPMFLAGSIARRHSAKTRSTRSPCFSRFRPLFPVDGFFHRCRITDFLSKTLPAFISVSYRHQAAIHHRSLYRGVTPVRVNHPRVEPCPSIHREFLVLPFCSHYR